MTLFEAKVDKILSTDFAPPIEKLQEWAEKTPDRVFLRKFHHPTTRTLNFAQVWDQVRRLASFLQSLSFEPGTKVAILGKNSPEWVVCDWAIAAAGFVSVPIYPNQSGVSMQAVLEHSDAQLVFVGKLDRGALQLPLLSPDLIHVFWQENLAPHSHSRQKFFYEDILKVTPPCVHPQVRRPEDLATIIYTSGTTGEPKGVMHSFRAFAEPATRVIEHLKFTNQDRFFSYLPLAHVAERFIVQTLALYSGGSITFSDSLESFAQDIQQTQPTIFMAVPRIWSKLREKVLLKIPERRLNFMLKIPVLSRVIRKKIQKSLGLSHLRIGVSGAAPLPVDVREGFQNFGIQIIEGYGMTENLAYSHLNPLTGSRRGSVGVVFPGVKQRISPEGEIQVASPANMMGYYKNPQASAAAFEEGGFLKTGDLGRITEGGYLEITGRLKDLFKTSKGKYIAPEKIEMCFSKSLLFEQVCVCGAGLPQPLALAVIQESFKQDPTLDLKKEIESFLHALNKTLDPHERLQSIILMNEKWSPENGLMTPTLKIKRQAIEKRYYSHLQAWAEVSEPVFVFDELRT